MTAKMAWKRAGGGRWVGAYQGCEHYVLDRHQDGAKVTWRVRRGETLIGEFDRKVDASVEALNDEWRVRSAENDKWFARQVRKSRADRDLRLGVPYEVIPREQGVHRDLELRVRLDDPSSPWEAWEGTVYEPEYNERYGELGVYRHHGLYPTKQLAQAGNAAAATEHIADARQQRQDIDRRVAEMMARP